MFAAIIYVLVCGCAWRALAPCFGASKSTVHRRFLIWPRAGVYGTPVIYEAAYERTRHAGLEIVMNWGLLQRRQLHHRVCRGRGRIQPVEEQKISVLCLRILQSDQVHVNTLMFQDALGEPNGPSF
ncbi:transposase [Streptomyces sp. PTM05]|uniref:Transposase n=1 Tax=Streptantibioticus parmotrematis TaxID=2873249 RepID=A0ABS7QVX0_9ACTN|nr:transposase [Streptantibioticus parmotrematis]